MFHTEETDLRQLLRKAHFEAPASARGSWLVLKESKLCQIRTRLMSDLAASTPAARKQSNLNYQLSGVLPIFESSPEAEKQACHHVTQITDFFGKLLHGTYAERLAELTEAAASRNIFRSQALRELQYVGKSLL